MASARLPTKPLAVVEDDNGPVRYEQNSAASANPYSYTPLPSKGHFRLLTLAPGQFNYQLDCEIKTFSLDGPDVPSYSAVSYTWNESQFDRLIVAGKRVPINDRLRSEYSIRHPLWCTIEGKPTEKARNIMTLRRKSKTRNATLKPRLLISTNLRDMLRRFRHPSKEQILWIDAICINQDDLDERASQILTMQRVYHEAEQVLFWVGEEDDDSANALRMLDTLSKIARNAVRGISPSPKTGDLYDPVALSKFGLPPFGTDSRDWKSLMKFFDRPVFARIWIVQELVAGRRVSTYCGSAAPVDFQVLSDAAHLIHTTGWRSILWSFFKPSTINGNFCNAILHIKRGWMMEPSHELRLKQLNLLLSTIQIFEASDPRDKVYAIIGLVNDYGHRDLHGVDKPDDGQSSSTQLQNNQLNVNFKVDADGSSEDDLAIDVLHMSNDPDIAKLRETLIRFFKMGTEVTDGVLNATSAKHTRQFQDRIVKEIEAITASLKYFGEKCRKKSKDHERASGFASRVSSMFADHILKWFGLTLEFTLDQHKEILRHPEHGPMVVEEVSRLQENLTYFLDILSKPAASKAKNKEPSVGLIGNRQILDNLDYSVKYERQFDDWAWSAAGWTVPDYRKPVREVYTEFTVKCMQDDNSLDALTLVQDRSARRIQDLPSWVPDFTVRFQSTPLHQADEHDEPIYKASGSTKAKVAWSVNSPNNLGVHGYCFGSLIHLSSRKVAASTHYSITQTAEWNSMVDHLPSKYITGVAKKEALWRTLLGDRIELEGKIVSPAPEEYGSYYDSLVRSHELSWEVESSADKQGPLANRNYSLQYLQRIVVDGDKIMPSISAVMVQRRLAVTDSGYLCAVPLSAQQGDQLHVLKGGPVPFVLRRSPQVSDTFELIGECYVHGLMFGEVLKWKGFKWDNITLN